MLINCTTKELKKGTRIEYTSFDDSVSGVLTEDIGTDGVLIIKWDDNFPVSCIDVNSRFAKISIIVENNQEITNIDELKIKEEPRLIVL